MVKGENMEWRLVKKWGRVYLEGRYKDGEWSGWLFPTDSKPHEHWIYIEEFDLYRRNTSV